MPLVPLKTHLYKLSSFPRGLGIGVLEKHVHCYAVCSKPLLCDLCTTAACFEACTPLLHTFTNFDFPEQNETLDMTLMALHLDYPLLRSSAAWSQSLLYDLRKQALNNPYV